MKIRVLVTIIVILFTASLSRAAETVKPVSVIQLMKEIRQLKIAMQQEWLLIVMPFLGSIQSRAMQGYQKIQYSCQDVTS